MIILGIETSCDETALAIIETCDNNGIFECRVISSLIHSQAELHSAYGGVFPTLAKREHEKNLVPLLEKILEKLKVDKKISVTIQDSRFKIQEEDTRTNTPTTEKIGNFNEITASFKTEFAEQNSDLVASVVNAQFLAYKPNIDAIAVTEGPGLEPALWTGIVFAKMLSRLWNIPVIPVNHMEGHVVGSLLESDVANCEWQKLKTLPMPALALLISGGHTELVKVETSSNKLVAQKFHYTIIGQTKDDAVGEAFDKVARLLGLPYPGGPHISKLAQSAREQGIKSILKLPRPMINSGDLNFSFSGLKTAVLYAVKDEEKSTNSKDNFLSDEFKKGLAREFEDSVTETLDAKLRKAIEETGAQSVIIGGGVSANSMLRAQFQKTATEYGIGLYLPSQHISGDNALMIALAGALSGPNTSKEIRAHGTKRLGN